MGTKITGKEYPLSKIFSSDFSYVIPPYQRPYAWTTEEAGILFDDLYDFMLSEPEEENYFLGSIVLIKEDDKPHSEVIDGQQRLTTLTILLSIIASKLTGNDLSDYRGYLQEPGRASQSLPAKPRLQLRKKDQEFFEKYVQQVGIDGLLGLRDSDLKDEAQQHIFKNAQILKEKLNEYCGDEGALKAFGQFVMGRCYLVAVWTPSQQSAFRVFSVMNNRGLDLLATDIIKADVLGTIPGNQQEEYTNKWEELENLTGRDEFNDLFGHIRMIFAKTKAKRSLLEEFRESVIRGTTPATLIDDVLDPYSEAYRAIRDEHCESSGAEATDINALLKWLNKINNSDWLPPAILYFALYKDCGDKLLSFLRDLERLAAFMLITSKDINARIERYAMIVRDIQTQQESEALSIDSIKLTDEEKRGFLKALDGEVYKLTAIKRNYLMLRLDTFVADGAATYDSKVLTIEHVLPQTINPNSDWAKTWSEDEHAEWLNRIANLIPLARRKNSAAQNYDFTKKKEVYFTSKTGTSSYALTTQVLNKPQWNKAIVSERQKALISEFKNGWRL
jgi:hypothetical protein